MNDNLSPEARVDAMQRQLNDQLASLNRYNMLTAIIGIVLILGVTGYFYYGYRKLDTLLEPEKLVDAGAAVVLDNLKPTREGLEKQIISAAPTVAKELSDQVYDALPKARAELENVIEERTKASLGDTAKLSRDQIRQFVKANRKELKESIETLKKDEDSEKVIKSLMLVVQREFGGEIKKASEELFMTLKQVNEQLDKIKKGNNLTPSQQTMRQIMMICRRVIEDQPKLETEIANP